LLREQFEVLYVSRPIARLFPSVSFGIGSDYAILCGKSTLYKNRSLQVINKNTDVEGTPPLKIR